VKYQVFAIANVDDASGGPGSISTQGCTLRVQAARRLRAQKKLIDAGTELMRNLMRHLKMIVVF
jgi:hypothetical protein